ncbi:MAG: DUF1153 domain-containing protein, partial [Rectinemataceae bacterium]|nr:DUF1153 domain-containing protein [Rectinemataceae bacterium]
PEPGCRWVPSRKEVVVEAITAGTVTVAQVLEQYPDLSLEELESWQRRYNRQGRKGLRVTKRAH